MSLSKVKKHLYIVRHGECAENKIDHNPNSASSLNLKGIFQSYFRSFKLLFKRPDIIITSELARSKETGMILQQVIKIPCISNDLFNERYFVSKTGHNYSNIESFDQLCTRCNQGLKFLFSREEKTIILISHATWMKMIIFLKLKHMKKEDFESFNSKYGLKNTAMMHVIFLESGDYIIDTVQPPFFIKKTR